jgi:predicted aldo/keto reductase-like oxidoreductase
MGTIQLTRLAMDRSIAVLREVAELGVNWFDTAQGYGDSEVRMGRAFEGMRDRVVLISKVGGRPSPAELDAAIDGRLERLRTDCLDVFMFHGLGAMKSPDFLTAGGLLETAEKAVADGRVRHLGFSAHHPERAVRALELDRFEVAMVPANFIAREFLDGGFLTAAREKNVGVMAMKPMGGGRLENAGACLRFLKSYPDVFPCVGIEHTREMAENVAAWKEDAPLSAEDERELERLRKLLGERFCRGCGYCLPCPQEINIPLVSFLDVLARQLPREMVVTGRNTEAAERAGSCSECRECVERCPYDLDVPAMLKQNVAGYRRLAQFDSGSRMPDAG